MRLNNRVLQEKLELLASTKKTLHIIGLLSDGKVHGDEHHMYAFIKAALQKKVARIVVHAILDGRDVAPRSATTYLERFYAFCAQHRSVHLGTVMGRFYAMDRDQNWNRTTVAYKALAEREPLRFKSGRAVLDYYYKQGVYDEFIPPTQLFDQSIIAAGDGIIFLNVRPDRARQLISALVESDFEHFATSQLHFSFFITPVRLDSWNQVTVLYEQPKISHTLKEIISGAGKSIYSIAETEKYAHVTYFFDGNRDRTYPNETRVLIPSIKAKNYINTPCMSANEITNAVIESLATDPKDFYLINYANADMVGHSGDLPATIKAVECVDEQLKKLYQKIVIEKGGTLFITGDHGNAELKYDAKMNQPRTAHTTNPVPFICVNQSMRDTNEQLPLRSLADIAPFILKTMQIA